MSIIINCPKKHNKYDRIVENGSDILALILLRFGDLTLKGKNQKLFVQRIKEILLEKTAMFPLEYTFQHDRIYLSLPDSVPTEAVLKQLSYVTGLHSYSVVTRCEKDLGIIAKQAIPFLQEVIQKKETTFKVESKRADKSFPLTSQEISKELSKLILREVPLLKVNMHEPAVVLEVEMRQEAAYFYVSKETGAGGFPVGIGGKGLVLLSGGIDSPVAAFLAMKKGLAIDCIHFESTPLTAIESVQKVIDLTQVLARYAPNSCIRLHLVPFEPLHSLLLSEVPEAYLVTIMRRMMVRIASQIAKANHLQALINGESLGQVASQTIESLETIYQVCQALVLRPLITYDKNEILALARKLETYAISVRPFEDCCTIYLPKSPSIRPVVWVAERYEEKLPYEEAITKAIANTKVLTIHANQEFDLSTRGLTVSEALQ